MKSNIYYAELSPFHDLFRSGVPLLCYHKIGRKPLGVKMRGIYLSPRLFARQMRELKAAGYRSISMDDCVGFADKGKGVVLTFDDGSRTVTDNATDSLASSGFRAINYLVSDLIGGVNQWDVVKGEVPDPLMDEVQVRDWMAAGHTIGAHTRTHPRLSRIPLAQAREEIFGSKKSLEDRFGVPMRHFCYPYGDYSLQVRDLVEEAGFATAVTIDPGVYRPTVDPMLISRICARAHSLNFRNVFKRLAGRRLVTVDPGL